MPGGLDATFYPGRDDYMMPELSIVSPSPQRCVVFFFFFFFFFPFNLLPLFIRSCRYPLSLLDSSRSLRFFALLTLLFEKSYARGTRPDCRQP